MNDQRISHQWTVEEKHDISVPHYEPTVSNYLDPNAMFDENYSNYGSMIQQQQSSPETHEDYSSLSNAPSDNSPSLEDTLDDTIIIDILHKPRGSKGIWSQISMHQRVRVTYGRGKNLQILIYATQDYLLLEENISLYLEQIVDDERQIYREDGFSIEKRHPIMQEMNELYPNHPYVVRYDVKIFVIHKMISFLVEFKENDQIIKSARSIEIFTHNSGRRECMNKRSQPSPMITSSNDELFNRTQLAAPVPFDSWTNIENNLNVNGVLRAQSFMQFSDIRLKSNIEDIVDALSIVSSLKGRTYEWKKGSFPGEVEKGGKRIIGLIAQEVKEVIPEVVEEVDGIFSVNYTEIIPILIEAFKDQVSSFEKFKDGINEEVSNIKERLNRIKENELERTDFKTQQEIAMIYLQSWIQSIKMNEVNGAHKTMIKKKNSSSSSNNNSNSNGKSKKQLSNDYTINLRIPLSQNDISQTSMDSSEDKNIFLQVKYFSKAKKWKIFAIVLLSLLILAGVTIGIYFGIAKNIKYKSPTLSNNLLLNPSFEDIDNHGKASGWFGEYWLLTTSDKYNPDKDEGNLIESIHFISKDQNSSEWPFSILPVDGSVMLHIFSNSSNRSNNFFARSSVPFVDVKNIDEIKYLNISTWATSLFNLNASIMLSAFQMNTIVHYEGDYSEVYGLDFDHDDQRQWNYKEIIIPISEMEILEYIEIIIVSTFEGYSFWDRVNVQYVKSELPPMVRLGKKRVLKECNGMMYCT